MLVLVVLVAGPLHAGGPWQDLEEGRLHFDAVRLSRAAQAFTQCQAPALSGCAQGAARAWLYLSYVRELDGDRRGARACLTPALRAAQAGADAVPDDARGLALLADVHGRFVLLGGLLDALAHGPANGAALKRALALAPQDPVVLAAEGRRFLFAPAIAGGDVKKAIDRLQRSQAVDGSDVTLYFLGLAWRKAGDEARARACFQASLALDPDERLSQKALALPPRP